MKNKHFDLLGLAVQDRVTGLKGVVTSLSFDLYGCIQAAVTAPAKDGKVDYGVWLDITRLKILNRNRVMDLPDFNQGYVAEGRKGASPKLPL
jgi:hypothetical protein